jgi:hypothetical protein
LIDKNKGLRLLDKKMNLMAEVKYLILKAFKPESNTTRSLALPGIEGVTQWPSLKRRHQKHAEINAEPMIPSRHRQ